MNFRFAEFYANIHTKNSSATPFSEKQSCALYYEKIKIGGVKTNLAKKMSWG